MEAELKQKLWVEESQTEVGDRYGHLSLLIYRDVSDSSLARVMCTVNAQSPQTSQWPHGHDHGNSTLMSRAG